MPYIYKVEGVTTEKMRDVPESLTVLAEDAEDAIKKYKETCAKITSEEILITGVKREQFVHVI